MPTRDPAGGSQNGTQSRNRYLVLFDNRDLKSTNSNLTAAHPIRTMNRRKPRFCHSLRLSIVLHVRVAKSQHLCPFPERVIIRPIDTPAAQPDAKHWTAVSCVAWPNLVIRVLTAKQVYNFEFKDLNDLIHHFSSFRRHGELFEILRPLEIRRKRAISRRDSISIPVPSARRLRLGFFRTAEMKWEQQRLASPCVQVAQSDERPHMTRNDLERIRKRLIAMDRVRRP